MVYFKQKSRQRLKRLRKQEAPLITKEKRVHQMPRGPAKQRDQSEVDHKVHQLEEKEEKLKQEITTDEKLAKASQEALHKISQANKQTGNHLKQHKEQFEKVKKTHKWLNEPAFDLNDDQSGFMFGTSDQSTWQALNDDEY